MRCGPACCSSVASWARSGWHGRGCGMDSCPCCLTPGEGAGPGRTPNWCAPSSEAACAVRSRGLLRDGFARRTPDMSLPELTVVTPTRNRASSVLRLLGALARQEPIGGAYEVVLVADGCTDATAMQVRSQSWPFDVHVIEIPPS